MPITRPYFLGFDGTADKTPLLQGDNAPNNSFSPISVSNSRNINAGSASSPTATYNVADLNVVSRNAKNIIWSSEGNVSNATNSVIAPLSAAQKILASTGKSDLTSIGNGPLDVSAFRNLVLMVNFASFTAGSSPSIQFELDMLDDTGTPNSFPLWKPTALTAAGSYYVSLGLGNGVLQAAAAPTAPTTGYLAVTNAVSGLLISSIPMAFSPNVRFAWTVTGTPTAAVWQAFLYGIH